MVITHEYYETESVKERALDVLLNVVGTNIYRSIGRIFPIVPDMYTYNHYVTIIEEIMRH